MKTIPHRLLWGILTLFAAAAVCSVAQQGGASPRREKPGAPPTGNTLAKAVAGAQPDKEGRIRLVDFHVATVSQEKSGMMLGQRPVSPPPTAYMADPTLRDEVKILFTPDVVARLKQLGIRDIAAHFNGKTLQVRGERSQVIYFCMPAIAVYTVTVDRLEDLRVTGVVDGDTLGKQSVAGR